MLIFFVLLFGWLAFLIAACVHFSGTKPLTWTLVMLLVVLVPTSFLEGRWRYNEHQYTEVARSLTGIDDVEVVCQRLGSNLVDVSNILGYVPYNTDGTSGKFAFLRRETCKSLATFRRSPGAAGPEEWLAVHVLTHEAMHLAGIQNEAMTECAAQQRDAITARLLGASPLTAPAVAVGYRETGLPRLGPDYHSEECASGRAWDENLPDPPWATTPGEPPPAGTEAWQPPFASNARPLP